MTGGHTYNQIAANRRTTPVRLRTHRSQVWSGVADSSESGSVGCGSDTGTHNRPFGSCGSARRTRTAYPLLPKQPHSSRSIPRLTAGRDAGREIRVARSITAVALIEASRTLHRRGRLPPRNDVIAEAEAVEVILRKARVLAGGEGLSGTVSGASQARAYTRGRGRCDWTIDRHRDGGAGSNVCDCAAGSGNSASRSTRSRVDPASPNR